MNRRLSKSEQGERPVEDLEVVLRKQAEEKRKRALKKRHAVIVDMLTALLLFLLRVLLLLGCFALGTVACHFLKALVVK